MGTPYAIVATPPLGQAGGAAGLWLLLCAFAAGCAAMTGVEAVSNGAGAFREPAAANAHRTPTIISLTLGLLLAGIALAARSYGLGAMDQTQPGYQSVLSQLERRSRAAAGCTTPRWRACSRCSASPPTPASWTPALCKLAAEDDFLPRQFAMADRRLVFSAGIAFLAVAAGALLVAFGGITDRLIPLFAIGAFLTFTMSQAGMVAHWRKQRPRNRGLLAVNALGAATTATAVAVIVVAKFTEGAWIVVLAIPLTIQLLGARPARSLRRCLGPLPEERVHEPRQMGIEPIPHVLLLTHGLLQDRTVGARPRRFSQRYQHLV